jgi:GH15 family glucan-1,4-alpha-glucosidase
MLAQFDSPSIFASLLDEDRGGSFELTPMLYNARHRQRYLPDTNVLLTRFFSPAGVAEISDFMIVGDMDAGSRLVRRVKAVRGTMRCRMRCMPRFDYARVDPKVCVDAGTVIFTGHDNLALRLRASVPVDVSDGAALAEFDLAAGESASFVVEDASYGDDSISAAPGYVSAAFKETIDYWRRWVRRSSYRGRWREIVSRSAIGTASDCAFAEPASERIRLLHVPESQKSVNGKGGVSQPSVSIIPVSNPADVLGQSEG